MLATQPTVKPGDTLIRVAESGQSWKDIARWNNLENANLIECPGRVLRVLPPSAAGGCGGLRNGVVTSPVPSSSLTPARPLRRLHQLPAAPSPGPVHGRSGGGSTRHTGTCGACG